MLLFFLFFISGALAIAIAFLFRTLRKKTQFVNELNIKIQNLGTENIELNEKARILESGKKLAESSTESERIIFIEKISVLEKYHKLVEGTQAFFLEIGPNGEFTYGNPSFLIRLGYSLEELKEFTIFNLISSETEYELERLLEPIDHFLTNDCYLELELLNRFNESIWLGLQAKITFNIDGKLVKIKGLGRDLTEIRNLETRSDFFSQNLGKIFLESKNAILVFSVEDGKDLASNSKLKWTNKFVLGLMNFDLFEVEGISLKEVSISLLEAVGKRLAGECRVIWSPSNQSELKFFVDADQNNNLLVINLIDCTESYLEQIKIQKSEELFRRFLNASNFEVSLFSEDEVNIFQNTAVIRRLESSGSNEKNAQAVVQKGSDFNILNKARFLDVTSKRKSITYDDFTIDENHQISYVFRELNPVFDELNNLKFFASIGAPLSDKIRIENDLNEFVDYFLFLVSYLGLSLAKREEKMSEISQDHKLIGMFQSFKVLMASRESKPNILRLNTYHLVPLLFSQIANDIITFCSGLNGIKVSFEIGEKDNNLNLFPVGLIQSTLKLISDVSLPLNTEVDIQFQISAAGQNEFLIRAEMSAIQSKGVLSAGHFFDNLGEIWKGEGLNAWQSAGYLNLSFPLRQVWKKQLEEYSSPLILNKYHFLIGPTSEPIASWLNDELVSKGAEVTMIQSVMALNKLIQNESFSLVIWCGKKLEELVDIDLNIFSTLEMEVLFFHRNKNFKPKPGSFPSFINPEMTPIEAIDAIEKILNVVNKVSKIKFEEKSELDKKLNFEKVIEITEGDKTFMASLFQSYFKSLEECRQLFLGHIESSDSEGLRFLLHKIRATTKTFEIRSLENVFNEAILMTEDSKPISKLEIKALSEKVSRICIEVANQIREYARKEKIKI